MTTPFSSAGFNGKPVPGFPIPLTSFKYGDFTGNFTAPEVDPYQALRDKYKTNTPAVDASKMDVTEKMIYSLVNPNPSNTILTAELNAIAAKDANKLARENIDYASKVQQEFNEKKTQRDFKYGALARLMEMPATIGANMANITLGGAERASQSFANILNTPSARFDNIQYQPSRFYG
jgi:hypothetical protein